MSAPLPHLPRFLSIHHRLKTWLFEEALPLWHAFGIDHATGAFHEVLGPACEIPPTPRRGRVGARQIFSFCAAGRLGWTGPWRRAALRGMDYFLDHALLADGTAAGVLAPDGTILESDFDLYTQSFALLAFASVLPIADAPARLEAAARTLADCLERRYKHPLAGFEEAQPRRLPLKANPHMHLLEAFLALERVSPDARWRRWADEIAALALSHFLDMHSGWIKEYFDHEWRPAPGEAGRRVEPGHQFEWAWLLTRWGSARQRPDADAAARSLLARAERHGVDKRRAVAINELHDDGTVENASARLWPQTERIKAHVLRALTEEEAAARAAHLAVAAEAAESLARYLVVETPGLWRDTLTRNGDFLIEPAPASSFYHIVCALEEMEKITPDFS